MNIKLLKKIEPRCKLLCLALLTSACLYAPLNVCLCIIACYVIFAFFEGMHLGRLTKETLFLIWFLVPSIITQLLSGNGLMLSSLALFASRLFAGYLGSRLFYFSTSRRDIKKIADGMPRIIPKKMRATLGISLLLVLSFVPLILQEWKETMITCKARGIPKKIPAAQLLGLLVVFLRRLIVRCMWIPAMLTARGWNTSSNVQVTRWRLVEYCVLALCIGILITSTVLLKI